MYLSPGSSGGLSGLWLAAIAGGIFIVVVAFNVIRAFIQTNAELRAKKNEQSPK